MAENTAQVVPNVELGKIPTRDRVLAEIESIINEKDGTIRADRTEKFISSRVAELTASSKPTTFTFANGVGTIKEGFVHPDSIIKDSYLWMVLR